MVDDHKLRMFYDKRMGAEIEADHLGDEWKGYMLRIAGGNDKQGFPMKQGVLANSKFTINKFSIAKMWNSFVVGNSWKSVVNNFYLFEFLSFLYIWGRLSAQSRTSR